MARGFTAQKGDGSTSDSSPFHLLFFRLAGSGHGGVEVVEKATLWDRRADVRSGRTGEARPPLPVGIRHGRIGEPPHSDVGAGGSRSRSTGRYSS